MPAPPRTPNVLDGSGTFLRRAGTWLVPMLLAVGCARHHAPQAEPAVQPAPEARAAAAPRIGFSIQAGAFAQPENAARLAERLQSLGLDAVYYASPPEAPGRRLYRVRFGDFPTREAARVRAEALRSEGMIDAFIVVAPEQPARPRPEDEQGLRANLVETANGYLGVPYLWGGSTGTGFDCSGLTMAVYRLNGLKLPRSSREQYAQGTRVSLGDARRGDLLFFATAGSGRVSHVGIYVGGDSFIHAPRRGRTITREKLAGYYREHLVGARCYL
jgi:hypothetical protein